jgi:hypothetical protein
MRPQGFTTVNARGGPKAGHILKLSVRIFLDFTFFAPEIFGPANFRPEKFWILKISS